MLYRSALIDAREEEAKSMLLGAVARRLREEREHEENTALAALAVLTKVTHPAIEASHVALASFVPELKKAGVLEVVVSPQQISSPEKIPLKDDEKHNKVGDTHNGGTDPVPRKSCSRCCRGRGLREAADSGDGQYVAPTAFNGLVDMTSIRVGPEVASPGDPRGLIPFIRATALKYGVNPDIAVRVAQSEGLQTFRCQIPGERSFGAFQLFCGGGLGNEFQQKTGLDASDPKNELATIDFALKYAAKGGWGPWHGAARVGIGKWTGIDRNFVPDNSLSNSYAAIPSSTKPGAPLMMG